MLATDLGIVGNTKIMHYDNQSMFYSAMTNQNFGLVSFLRQTRQRWGCWMNASHSGLSV